MACAVLAAVCCSSRVQLVQVSLEGRIQRLQMFLCNSRVSLGAKWCWVSKQVNSPAIFHLFAKTSRQLRSNWTLLGQSGSCMTTSPSLMRTMAPRNTLYAIGGTKGPRNDRLPDELMSLALWQIDSMTGSVVWIAALSMASCVVPELTIPRCGWLSLRIALPSLQHTGPQITDRDPYVYVRLRAANRLESFQGVETGTGSAKSCLDQQRHPSQTLVPI
jgi:hypothetical protein